MTDMLSTNEFVHIVIGGGIAGVTCVETLSSLSPDAAILLLTASPIIKAITNFQQVTKTLESFDVVERPVDQFRSQFSNVTIVQQRVTRLDSQAKLVVTQDGTSYHYNKLCLCTGGTPKLIAKNNPYVLGIRDTETVKVFQGKLVNAKRIVVVGNGGIATELVHQIEGCQIIWAIKDDSITSAFVDAGAAKFFLSQLHIHRPTASGPSKRTKYGLSESTSVADVTGCALGPDWLEGLSVHGSQPDRRQIHIEYSVEVRRLWTNIELKSAALVPCPVSDWSACHTEDSWPVYVELTNGQLYGCDFVVSATGVVPNTSPFVDDNPRFVVAADGGIKVSSTMQTGVPDVFAAGDVCHADWTYSQFWLQMRLWSQARQMGHYAAQCMVADTQSQLSQINLDFWFELFAHVTQFFNYKVILLGRFNGQGLDNDYRLLIRVTEGQQYVKVVLRHGKMVGAILVGDTDLEETFENLILNQLDLSRYGDELLSQDIEDFFD